MPDKPCQRGVQVFQSLLTDPEHLSDSVDRYRSIQQNRVVAQRPAAAVSTEDLPRIAGHVTCSKKAGVEILHSYTKLARSVTINHCYKIWTHLVDGASHAVDTVVVRSDDKRGQFIIGNPGVFCARSNCQRFAAVFKVPGRSPARRFRIKTFVHCRIEFQAEYPCRRWHDLPDPGSAHFRISLRVVGRLDEGQVLHILVEPCILQYLSNNPAISAPPAQRIPETILVPGLTAEPMGRTADLVRRVSGKHREIVSVLASSDLFSSFHTLGELQESRAKKAFLVLDVLGVAATAADFSPEYLVDPVRFDGIVKHGIPATPAAVNIDPEVHSGMQFFRTREIPAAG